MATASDADEATSVITWFEFYTRLYDDDVHVARPSRTLLQLLHSAFPTLYDEIVTQRQKLGSDEWACAILLLEAFYEVELGINRSTLQDAMTFEHASLQSACINILEYVVCALVRSDSKARFVGDIMAMDDSVQVDIMTVIERVMMHTATLATNKSSSYQDESEHLQSYDNSCDGKHVATPTRSLSGSTSSFSSPAIMSSRSPLHLANNAEMERLQRANEILKEDNIHIAKELGDIKVKLEHAQAENTTLLETVQSIKVQAEMDVLKKERVVRSYFDERVHSLQRELDRVTAELEEKTAVAREVNELRDEIDLLRPSADKLARAEATVAKYKTKIEDLASVNEKFRRTEEANAELVEKNLMLEKQAAKATMLQRKLDDSKEANTTIQFHVSELDSKLSRLTTDLEAKRLECESTSAALLEAKSMNDQLQRTVDQQIDARGGYASSAGSAGGISELNPALMEKLARLEHENSTLRSQVDGTTSDRIDALLDDINDLKRMKKSFETKYFDTTDLLKETETNLKNAEETVSKLQEELDGRTHDLHETTAHRDGVIQALEGAERRVRELADTVAADGVEIKRRVELERSLSEEIGRRDEENLSLQLRLRQTVQQLQLSSERSERLCEDVIAQQWARRDLVVCRDELLGKIQSLEMQCSSLMDTTAELESERDGLRQQLSDADNKILNLRNSEDQFAMRCEELHGILITKAAQIDAHKLTISQLTKTTEDMKKNLVEVDSERQSQVAQIQLLTERLHFTTEDLVLVQSKRLHLMKDVERLQEQDFHSQEELRQSQEIACATVEDYEHQLFVCEERRNDELAVFTSAHEAQLQKAADVQASLIADHAFEVERLSEEKANTITRMTGMIDEKCSLLQQSKSDMNALRDAHQCAMEKLRCRLEQEKVEIENQRDVLAADYAQYAAKHSCFDEDVNAKEVSLQEKLSQLSTTHSDEMARLSQQCDLLNDQVRRLQDANRDMKTRFESQEGKLREAVKSQLEANRKLVDVNHAVKNELAKKEAHVVQLENASTRLDSRIRMFERERTHYSSDENCKRDTEELGTSYSSQMNSHMTHIMEELDALRSEHKALQQELGRRPDDRNDSRDGSAPQSTKTYLLEKIRQLEFANAQEKDKKREMLMINAKLIQDHAQIQVRNASDSKEVQLLKEKVNTWMLRDERRKKEHEAFAQRVQALESENSHLRATMQTGTVEPLLSDLSSFTSHESRELIAPLDSRSSDDQENIPPTDNSPSPTVLQKKRKIESIDEQNEEPQNDDPHQHKEVSDASLDDDVQKPVDKEDLVDTIGTSSVAAPRAKRRMSLFFSNRLASETTPTTQLQDEKPSECQQQ